MKIAILGAGVAGLATAHFLYKQNLEFELFEKEKLPVNNGLSFFIKEKGFEVLEKIGVSQSLQSKVNVFNKVIVFSPQGKLLKEKKIPPHYLMNRIDLISSLINFLPGHYLHFNSKVSITPDARSKYGYAVNNDSRYMNPQLIIAADGSRSRTRSNFFPKQVVKINKIGEVLSRSKVSLDFSDFDVNSTILQVSDLKKRVSINIANQADGNYLWCFRYGINNPPQTIKTVNQMKTFILEKIKGWIYPIEDLISATNFNLSYDWKFQLYEQGLNNYFQKNLVLIGDAAHPFHSITGVGANNALIDGLVLAKSLKNSSNIHEGLTNYQRQRITDVRNDLLDNQLAIDNFWHGKLN